MAKHYEVQVKLFGVKFTHFVKAEDVTHAWIQVENILLGDISVAKPGILSKGVRKFEMRVQDAAVAVPVIVEEHYDSAHYIRVAKASLVTELDRTSNWNINEFDIEEN